MLKLVLKIIFAFFLVVSSKLELKEVQFTNKGCVESGDYISATQLMLIAHSLSRPVPVWLSADLPLLSQAVHYI